jgi:hypothetical protein
MTVFPVATPFYLVHKLLLYLRGKKNSCSEVDKYQRSGRTCCLDIRGVIV